MPARPCLLPFDAHVVEDGGGRHAGAVTGDGEPDIRRRRAGDVHATEAAPAIPFRA